MMDSKTTYEVFMEIFEQTARDGHSAARLNFYLMGTGKKLVADVIFNVEDMDDDNHV